MNKANFETKTCQRISIGQTRQKNLKLTSGEKLTSGNEVENTLSETHQAEKNHD